MLSVKFYTKCHPPFAGTLMKLLTFPKVIIMKGKGKKNKKKEKENKKGKGKKKKKTLLRRVI